MALLTTVVFEKLILSKNWTKTKNKKKHWQKYVNFGKVMCFAKEALSIAYLLLDIFPHLKKKIVLEDLLACFTRSNLDKNQKTFNVFYRTREMFLIFFNISFNSRLKRIHDVILFDPF